MLILFLWYLVPVWDRFATTVAVGVFGRHGATQDLALRGKWSEWPGSVHDKREGFVGILWSTRMGMRGQVFRSVGKVRYLCRVYLIYR